MSTNESDKLEVKPENMSPKPSSGSIVKEDIFYDAVEDKVEDVNKVVKLIGGSSQVSFKDHFFQKFNEWNLWRVLIGSFCSAIFMRNNWFLTSIILFVSLITVYIQWNKGEKAKAKEYCAEKISENPDRLKKFLSTVSAPQNLNSGKSGDAPCDWINDICAKFWPYINSIVQNQIDKKGFSKAGLNVGNGHAIHFERFTLGDKPPAITSIHVKKTGRRKDEITITLKIIYFGNCLLLFSYKSKVFLKAKAGVKDIYFRGEAIIVLRPLLETPPFVGGISFCLEEPPIIDYDGINLANIADNSIFKNFFISIISMFLVSPNKIYVPLMHNSNIKRELKFPLPIGLCYIEVIEADSLPAINPNKLLVFEGSNDVICKVKIGDFQFITRLSYGGLNPYFGQSFSAPIHDLNDFLKMQIFHKDLVNGDDKMGSVEFKISEIRDDKNFNGRAKWLPIGKSPTGSLHFRVAVFDLSIDKKNVNKVSSAAEESSCKFPVAVFSVYVHYVSQISTADEEENFKPVVSLKFEDQSFQTKTAKPPNKGYYYFEEASHFMCHDLQNDVLEVSVICQDSSAIVATTTKDFGSCQIHIKDIINSRKSMAFTKGFPIKKTRQLNGITETKESGLVRMFLSLTICKYRKRLFENLKIPVSVQSSIEHKISEDLSITKLVTEPISTVRNPIRTLKTIGYTALPFTAPDKLIITSDLLPIPINLGNQCFVKARVKWPDRRALHVEVLKVIEIPLNIVDITHKYSICVKLSLKQKFSESQSHKQKFKGFNNAIRKGLKLKNEPKDRLHLESQQTKKQYLENLMTDVVFNERLSFKLSPLNNIDNHMLDFLLIVHKPRKFFAALFDSSLVASSGSCILPVVDFKGDPIEEWHRLDMHQKFLSVKTIK